MFVRHGCVVDGVYVAFWMVAIRFMLVIICFAFVVGMFTLCGG